ncbi:putative uncharacterized protein [Blautia hydrogenotrophica CAG:147]|nr:putative uncharacterized protein [Blautia hydrogenotrophica CAG:147]
MALNRSTLSEQIYEILRNDILSQKIPCGEKLTLNTLKERFQVSSTPIRDALTRLEKDGLLQYYSNIGVNVIDLNAKDLKELFTFMGDLDALAIRYASGYPQQQEVRRALIQNLEETQKYLNTSDIRQWRSCSDGLHLVFYQYCDNSRLCSSALQMRSQITIYSNRYEREVENREKVFEEHQKIASAFLNGDIEGAVKKMQSHLQDSLAQALCLL